MGKIITLTVVGVAIVGAIVWLEKPVAISECHNKNVANIFDLSFSDKKGVCHKIQEYKAPVTVVNSWASWCPFCVEELPNLEKLAREYPNISVVAINRGEDPQKAIAFTKEKKIGAASHTLFDPEDYFYKYIKGFGMPETVFLGEKGEILFHKRGVMSYDEMTQTIQMLLSKVQPATATESSSVCLGNNGVCGSVEHKTK